MDINRFTEKSREALTTAQGLAPSTVIRKWTPSIWRSLW